MPEELKDAPETTEVEEPLDFDDSESRMAFLKSQMNDLLDGINNVYGQELLEELLKRLEKTVENFNIEVSGLMNKLKEGKIFGEDQPDTTEDPLTTPDDNPELDEDHPTVTFEDQEAEDADVIARMRKRITHD